MEAFIIHTERLRLRALTPEMYEQLFQLPEAEAMEFFGYSDLSELNSERNRFLNGLRTYNKSFLYFQLIEKTTDAIIGWCGYHTWYLDHNRAEIGYGLFSDEVKRKGFMTEAVPPILNYGFSKMNLHRIEAFASPDNIPSVKLLKTNNFVSEGLLKEHYLKDGVYENSEIFGLIRTKTTS